MRDSKENRPVVDRDLIKMYSIYSVSGTEGEKEICDWLCQRLDEMGKHYARLDNTLYHIVDGNSIYLSAHLDQVATNGRAEHIYQADNGCIGAFNSKWQRTSLGADDKNGVWIILKMLEAGYEFDWSITESEEVGCVGIKKIENILPESTADYCIVLDRKGNSDILNKGGSTNYCEGLAYNLKNFFKNGYVVTTGTLSDTQTICKYIESVNMSVAYHDPHRATEITDYNRLVEIKNDIERLFKEEFVHYPADPEDYKETYSYTNYWKGQTYDNWK